MSNYNTNLASEFYVLSTLHRLGADATLTLGNKKAVDIFVSHSNRRVVTIDVKGVAGPYDWPADNIRSPINKSHYLVLVSYRGQISDPQVDPEVWVVPYKQIKSFIKQYRGRRNVSRASVRSKGKKFYHAWHLITGTRTHTKHKRT